MTAVKVTQVMVNSRQMGCRMASSAVRPVSVKSCLKNTTPSLHPGDAGTFRVTRIGKGAEALTPEPPRRARASPLSG